jgi:phage tail-like protein
MVDGREQMSESISSYLDYLPAIFRERAEVGPPDFLAGLLRAFEKVLTGCGDAASPGLEEILEGIGDSTGNVQLAGSHRYFDPGPELPDAERAPEEPGREFVTWLAGWVALAMREDWEPRQRRRILSTAVSSYRRRGTKDGLRQVLAAYSGLSSIITEFVGPQVGVRCTVGQDILLGGPPHYFRVLLLLTTTSPSDLARKGQIVRAIIDAEKPAHTQYDLRVESPAIQVGVRERCTVGESTLLGTIGDLSGLG